MKQAKRTERKLFGGPFAGRFIWISVGVTETLIFKVNKLRGFYKATYHNGMEWRSV